jgi:hypothetical protein
VTKPAYAGSQRPLRVGVPPSTCLRSMAGDGAKPTAAPPAQWPGAGRRAPGQSIRSASPNGGQCPQLLSRTRCCSRIAVETSNGTIRSQRPWIASSQSVALLAKFERQSEGFTVRKKVPSREPDRRDSRVQSKQGGGRERPNQLRRGLDARVYACSAIWPLRAVSFCLLSSKRSTGSGKASST